MTTQIQNQQELDQPSALQVAAERGQKKPYVSFRLTTYGDLRNLTQAGTKGRAEGNSSSSNKIRA